MLLRTTRAAGRDDDRAMVGVSPTKGQRDRELERTSPRGTRSRVVVCAFVVALALPSCDMSPWTSPPATTAPPTSAADPLAECPRELDPRDAPLDRVARCEEELTRAAQRLEGTADAVAHALRASELARARAVREQDDAALDRSRALLVLASRRRTVEGACEAAIALAELEARDRANLAAAYIEAHRTVRRFDDGAHADCVERARTILATLTAFRPPAATLAAVDADPDGDDPSIGLTGSDATGATEATTDPFAAWASAQPAAASASLTSISVFGSEAVAGRVPRAARTAARPSSARVVLSISDLVRFESSEIAADGELPRRFAILLPATSMGAEVASAAPVGSGGLLRVRASADGPGTRVTLDLEGDAVPVLFVLPEPFRVIIDVRSAGAAADAVAPSGPRTLDLLVLDPGHGGDDFGARAFGLEEQDITLDLATRVRDILRARLPSTRVVLTREENRFVSLEQRTAMANAVGADVFVSIHLNAAWEDVIHGGVTTFVLDTTDDRQAVRLAARENGTSETEVGALSRILAGIHRDEQSDGSRALAEQIHRATLSGGRRVLPRLYDRGVRSAMFHVLVGAAMPAVLVEASFMTRREEADALRTEGYRQSLAEGIADGIVAYARGDAPTP